MISLREIFFGGIPMIEATKIKEPTRDGIDDMLNQIQKKHQKRKEKTENKQQTEIEQLKAKLQEYIQKEEYEKAATIRDLIKKKENS